MESEALTALLNNYFTEMSEIALRYGGTIDKYIGDAIMIFFGDPESKGEKEDAIACVTMAIEMRERMKYLRKKWENEGINNSLQVRIGINTGHCTVGNFGSENRLDYTIIGGSVNLASRLESNSEPDQILISNETYALVKDKIDCELKGEIHVKGIARAIKTYQVIGLREGNIREDKLFEQAEGFTLTLDLSQADKNEVTEILKDTLEKIQRKPEEE
jgi:class 3 adenylate cyclase